MNYRSRQLPIEDFFTYLSKDVEKILDGTVQGYSCSHFPPVNIYAKEDKSLTYEFALAGYNKENIDIEFDSNYMILTLKAPKDKKDYGKRFYHRLKIVDAVEKYEVPSDKYLYDEAKADMKDGILIITIPSKEPKKVKINL